MQLVDLVEGDDVTTVPEERDDERKSAAEPPAAARVPAGDPLSYSTRSIRRAWWTVPAVVLGIGILAGAIAAIVVELL